MFEKAKINEKDAGKAHLIAQEEGGQVRERKIITRKYTQHYLGIRGTAFARWIRMGLPSCRQELWLSLQSIRLQYQR